MFWVNFVIYANTTTMDKLINSIFGSLPRQGPGERNATLKALEAIPKDLKEGTILDIGAGTGAQTILLLENTNANVIALDSNKEFIQTLLNRARNEGFDSRIKGIEESMHSIHLPTASIDIIWCEGAIYHITPEKGLIKWKHLLKPNGYFAFTDLCWVRPNPPKRILNYWKSNYPKMKSFDDIEMVVDRCGYDLVTSFTLSQSAWTENYYDHLERKVKIVEQEAEGVRASELFEAIREEMQLFEEYREFYNYGFFVAKLRS